MKVLKAIFLTSLCGAVASLVYGNYLQDRRIDALEDALVAHREDAKTAVVKVYEDLNRVRFTQKALANTLRFVAPKEAK